MPHPAAFRLQRLTAGARALAVLAGLLALAPAAFAQSAPGPSCPFEVPASAPPFTLPRAVDAIGAGAPLRILAIGSSSTAGFGASGSGQAYPAQLAGRLNAALAPRAVTVTNGGVSGETGPTTLRRLEAAMAAPEPPQIVIWQVGTNDVLFGGTPAGLEALVVRGLDAVAAAGGVPIVVDQQYFRGILNLAHYEAFVAAVHRAAASRGAALLGRYAVMKHWAHAAPGAFETIMALDRFHMGDRGYACLADLLATGILAKPPAASPQMPQAAPAPGRPPAGAATR